MIPQTPICILSPLNKATGKQLCTTMNSAADQAQLMSDLSSPSPSPSSGTRSVDDLSGKPPGDAPQKRPLLGTPLKRVIDETQLSPKEAELLEKRRAYNRLSATRARKRNKHLVCQLQDEVATLTKEKHELQRANEEMKTRMRLLEKHNQTLLLKQLTSERQRAASLAATLYQYQGGGGGLGGLPSVDGLYGQISSSGGGSTLFSGLASQGLI